MDKIIDKNMIANITSDKIFNSKICCIGAGYVGGPTSVVIASQCPNIRVTVVDNDEDKIKAWNSNNIPIYEPNLRKLVSECRYKNLFFKDSRDIEKSIKEADIIILAVNTPTKTYGVGADYTTDLTYINSAIELIAAIADTPKIIVEKSTVPCKTSEYLQATLKSLSNIKFEILSNPEFLSEGTAIKDLLEPSRVIIGSDNTESGKQAAEILATVYRHWVPNDRILTIDIWSSELAKLAANAMLAQRISSINSLSAICDKVGADVKSISKAIGMDPRIGSKFLNPSIGFGGSCFKKDILSLVYFAKSLYLYEVADYWEQVVIMNEYQKNRCSEKLLTYMHTMKDKKICLFGFSYKKDTGDTRESAAIDIFRFLFKENASISIYDPKVPEKQIRNDIDKVILIEHAKGKEINYKQTIKINMLYRMAVEDASAIIIATEWNEFKTYDYKKIYDDMKKPAIIFDGRLIFTDSQIQELKKIGFIYISL